MSIRPVLRLPHPALRTACRPSGQFDEDLMRDLIDTMRASPACVGLAANQIGAGVRALVVDGAGREGLYLLLRRPCLMRGAEEPFATHAQEIRWTDSRVAERGRRVVDAQ